jgi:hypothetical protein
MAAKGHPRVLVNAQGEPVAAVRDRYVRRAENLKSHRPFLDALAAARAGWNDRYPTHRLPQRVDDIPEDLDPDAYSPFDPPPLVRRSTPPGPRLGVVPGYFLPTDREPTPAELTREAWSLCVNDWGDLKQRLCEAWWPPEWFPPTPFGRYGHPALKFVWACLYWKPCSLEAKQWIAQYPLRISYTSRDLFGIGPPMADPEVEYHRVLHETFRAGIRAASRTGEPITDAIIDREEETARAMAVRARSAAVAHESRRLTPYFAIFPGMTWRDWRAMERPAVDAAEERRPDALPAHWRVIARKLREDGMSANKIAFSLGISLSTVQRELRRR